MTIFHCKISQKPEAIESVGRVAKSERRKWNEKLEGKFFYWVEILKEFPTLEFFNVILSARHPRRLTRKM